MNTPAYRLRAELKALEGEYQHMAMHRYMHRLREDGDTVADVPEWTTAHETILAAHYRRICEIQQQLEAME